MQKVTPEQVRQFLSAKKIAMAGVSRDKNKMGHILFTALRSRGIEVFPVNPHADLLDGLPCFRTVSALPKDISHLIIMTPREVTPLIMRESLDKGITQIWVQQGAESEASMAVDTGLSNVIQGKCLFMFLEPVRGIHAFHRFIARLTGLYLR